LSPWKGATCSFDIMVAGDDDGEGGGDSGKGVLAGLFGEPAGVMSNGVGAEVFELLIVS
jgi:hypothetical protein